MLIDQILTIYPTERKQLEEDLFEAYREETGLEKTKKRDLTRKEFNEYFNWILGYFAMERGDYLLAPNEKKTENLWNT